MALVQLQQRRSTPGSSAACSHICMPALCLQILQQVIELLRQRSHVRHPKLVHICSNAQCLHDCLCYCRSHLDAARIWIGPCICVGAGLRQLVPALAPPVELPEQAPEESAAGARNMHGSGDRMKLSCHAEQVHEIKYTARNSAGRAMHSSVQGVARLRFTCPGTCAQTTGTRHVL